MSDGKQIAKNASWLALATTLNKAIAFFTFAKVAGLVGPEITGIYFYSVSITSVFVILTDLGMTPVVIRAIAGARHDAGKLLSASLRLKIFLSPIAILASLIYGYLNHADAVTLGTIGLACLVMTADTYHLALYGALRGRQNLRPEAIGMLIGQVLTAIVMLSSALLHFGPIGLAAGLLLGSTWNVCWAVFKTKSLSVMFQSPELRDYKRLFREAVPFGVAGISVKLYSYFDSLMIKVYHGVEAVGYYAVSYKMTYALQFLPLTFTAALYPALANSWAKKDTQSLRRTFLGSLRFMAFLGFPLSAGLSALAPQIIGLFFPGFNGSIPSFSILPWVLLPIFMDFPVGSLLNATHRAHLKTTAMLCTVVINIVLNILLVPDLGPLGAAWAGVFSFWSLFFIGMYFTAKDAGRAAFVWILVRASFCAMLSWIAWKISVEHMPFFAAFVFGGSIAVLLAFLVKLITTEDVKWILRRPGIKQDETTHADS
ncbi:MAG: flippase [Patescibacteria group bacterium]